MPIVNYAIKYASITITEAEHELIRNCYQEEKKVIAIKYIRMAYQTGLKESKDICDAVACV